MYKPLADSTLQRMKKTEIIELLRIAEHNAKVAQEYVDQQAENIKDWAPVVHGRWEWLRPNRVVTGCMCGTCSACGVRSKYIVNTMVCPNCGAKMDMRDTVNNNENKEIG